ncbi:unnamed protein product, partial [Linum tenue]
GTTRFKLPQTVSYSEEDVKLAHYIFAEDLPPDEPLVQTMMEVYSRKTLWSLCPDSCVHADVITALACHLTLDELWRDADRGKRVCFLPTEFQVCLPMQDTMDDGGIHWFLAIILVD